MGIHKSKPKELPSLLRSLRHRNFQLFFGGSIWDAPQGSFSLRPCATQSVTVGHWLNSDMLTIGTDALPPYLEPSASLTRSLPLLGSDVEWRCCLLTPLLVSQARRVKRHHKNKTEPLHVRTEER